MVTLLCQEPGCTVVLSTQARPYLCRTHRRSTCCGDPTHRYRKGRP